jgi:hypothetical protein
MKRVNVRWLDVSLLVGEDTFDALFRISSQVQADVPYILYGPTLDHDVLHRLGYTIIGLSDHNDLQISDLNEMNDYIHRRIEFNPSSSSLLYNATDKVFVPSAIGIDTRETVFGYLYALGKIDPYSSNDDVVSLGAEDETVLSLFKVYNKRTIRGVRLVGLPVTDNVGRDRLSLLSLIETGNFLTDFNYTQSVGVSLFAISNKFNPEPVETITWLSQTFDSYIALYPTYEMARYWQSGFNGINFIYDSPIDELLKWRNVLVLSPSGSGKSFWIEHQDDGRFVDLDNILMWPPGDWWLTDDADAVNKHNAQIVNAWLHGGKGHIGFYADTMGNRLTADVTVVIDADLHVERLILKGRDPVVSIDEGIFNDHTIDLDNFDDIYDLIDTKCTMETAVARRGLRRYTDHTVSSVDLLPLDCSHMPLGEFLSALEGLSTQHALYNNRRSDVYARRNHPMYKLWRVVYSDDLDPYYGLQTVWFTQTLYARRLSPIFARCFQLHDQDLHFARNYAMLRYHPTAVAFIDQSVNGYYLKKGDKYYLSVSGHLLNIIIYFCLYGLDMRRYLDSLQMNASMHHRKRHIPRSAYKLTRIGKIVEAPSVKYLAHLWHSFDEYMIAVEAVYFMVKQFNLPICPEVMLYVRTRLMEIKNRYPSFDEDMSQSALEYKMNL